MNYKLFPKLLTESEVSKQVISLLKQAGWLVIRINSGAAKTGNRFISFYRIQNNGLSKGLTDIIAFKGTKYLLLELKKGTGGKLSESQKEFIQLCESKGIQVHVIKDVSQVESII